MSNYPAPLKVDVVESIPAVLPSTINTQVTNQVTTQLNSSQWNQLMSTLQNLTVSIKGTIPTEPLGFPITATYVQQPASLTVTCGSDKFTGTNEVNITSWKLLAPFENSSIRVRVAGSSVLPNTNWFYLGWSNGVTTRWVSIAEVNRGENIGEQFLGRGIFT